MTFHLASKKADGKDATYHILHKSLKRGASAIIVKVKQSLYAISSG